MTTHAPPEGGLEWVLPHAVKGVFPLSQKFFKEGLAVAGNNDMVITDGLCEEVTGFLRLHLKDHLRAAEIVLVLVLKEFSLCGKETVQFP